MNAPQRRWPVVLVAVVGAVLLAFTLLSGFFVDLLWFREVGFTSVFWTTLRTKVLLGVIFGLAFFALLYVNLQIVRRLTPKHRPLTPDQEIIERYRQAFEPYLRWLILGFAALIAVFVGVGAASQWRTYLMWRNASGASFGIVEPLLDRDPAFYVFSLPWLRFVQGWLFSSLVGVGVLVGIAHYLWGGIRPQAPGEKVTAQVKAHLSVLLGVVLLVKAWGYWLGRFDLLTSPRGVVDGASFTDVNAQLPALRLLMLIAIVCALVALATIRFRTWAPSVIAVGLLVLASVVLGTSYPTFVQRFRVAPQELQRERPYIEHNIAFTRRAFQLDQVETIPRETVAPSVEPQELADNALTVSNIRLWRPVPILRENYEGLQRIRRFYEFGDIDVDRYLIDGEPRMVMFSAREVSQDGIPGGGGTWQNRHLVYTHGYGAVASQVNTSTAEGSPLFVLKDIPPVGVPEIEEPRVYYGEREDVPFVVVDSGEPELDYQGTEENDQEQVTFAYDGEGGIPVGGLLRRALFAWRFRDVNLLISSLVKSDSRIMINRDINERVPKAAPFLEYDGDPYSAVVDGRLVWIWDAYTTTNEYPYSQRLDLSDSTFGDLSGQANYIRNSVKVVVDAYDGTMRYYIVDPQDPIVQVWSKVFPDLFTPVSEASEDLKAHFRFPENLFQVQAAQFTNYHVTDPSVFYQKQDFWAVAGDPTQASGETTAPPPMRPYYLLMKLPGEDTEEFVLILPFTPEGRQNMVAWMAARSDPEHYGEVIDFEFPVGRNVDGPTQVFARINQDPDFSAERTLLGQSGSDVVFGDFLVIPIEDALLYVQPVFIRSAQQNTLPELKRVLVVNGGSVGIGSDLPSALADAIGKKVPLPGGEKPPPGKVGGVEGEVADLLDQALEAFGLADAALRDGNLSRYEEEIARARKLIRQAADLSGGALPATLPSPSPSPTQSP